MSFLRWDCKWPLSTERNTFIRTRGLTHCCPLKSVSPTRRPTVSHTTVNAAGQADRLAHREALLQEGEACWDRDPRPFTPSPLRAPASVRGRAPPWGCWGGPAGTHGKNFGWGRRGRGTAWLAQGAVGWFYMFVQFFRGADALLAPADHWGSGSELHEGQQYFCRERERRREYVFILSEQISAVTLFTRTRRYDHTCFIFLTLDPCLS